MTDTNQSSALKSQAQEEGRFIPVAVAWFRLLQLSGASQCWLTTPKAPTQPDLPLQSRPPIVPLPPMKLIHTLTSVQSHEQICHVHKTRLMCKNPNTGKHGKQKCTHIQTYMHPYAHLNLCIYAEMNNAIYRQTHDQDVHTFAPRNAYNTFPQACMHYMNTHSHTDMRIHRDRQECAHMWYVGLSPLSLPPVRILASSLWICGPTAIMAVP